MTRRELLDRMALLGPGMVMSPFHTLTPVGFDIPTPPVPASGEDVVNRNPYLVQMIVLSPGQVSEWTLADAGGSSRTIAAGLSAGQSLVLKPGDRIRFTYTVAPSWTWNALG